MKSTALFASNAYDRPVATGAAETGRSRRALLIRAGALLGAGAVAAACGGTGGGAGDVGPAGQVKGAATIRWSTWGNAQNPFNSMAAPKGMELFKQKFPNVTVQVEDQGDGFDFVVKNATAWVSGDGPDLAGHCCEFGIGYARQGFLLDMDPYIKRDAKQIPMADYVDWLMKLFSLPEAGQFALPMYTGTMALGFDRQAFKKKGLAVPDDTWDWNTYREVAQKLADPDNGVFARDFVSDNNFPKRFHQGGANMVDPKDDTKAAFTSEKAIAALQYEKDTIWKDRSSGIVSGANVPDALKGSDLYKRLLTGRIALFEAASFGLTRYVQNLKDDLDWDVAPLPKGPAGRFTLATNDGWSLWKGTKNREAAWQLMAFLQSDEWTDIATSIVGQQSARKSFQQRWIDGIKKTNPKLADKNLKPFTDAIEKGYARPIEIWRKHAESSKEFTAAFNKTVRDNEEEIGTAMRVAADLINQINKG